MKHGHSPSGGSARAAYGDQRIVEDRVRRFLPMVHKAAWHIYGAGRDGLDVEDLVQVGLMALTECARRHDGPTEDGFAAYAKMRVRGAMFDVLRKMAPISRGAIKRLEQYAHKKASFNGAHGRNPTVAELAALLEISADDVLALEHEQIEIGSIDAFYSDSAATFATPEPNALVQLCTAEDSNRLAQAIAALPERLQQVLQMYFVEELNLAEIAAVLEVSVPRIHQLKASAIGKLEALMTA